MLALHPYLNFDGDCRQAFQHYAKVFRSKDLSIMTFAEAHATEGMPKSAHKQVMHARITLGKAMLMGSDAPGGRFKKQQGFAVSVAVDKPAEADRIFKALAAGGEVTMPIAKTFWAKRFGMLTDRFGIPWMVNCE